MTSTKIYSPQTDSMIEVIVTPNHMNSIDFNNTPFTAFAEGSRGKVHDSRNYGVAFTSSYNDAVYLAEALNLWAASQILDGS